MNLRKILKRLSYPYYDLTLPLNGPGDYRYECAMKRSVFKQTRGCVAGGTFKGMKYGDEALGSAWFPKLLGIYEHEIEPWITSSLGATYKTIINVGSAEGYYAVGFARSVPDGRVFAFDIDVDCQVATRALGRMNGIEGNLEVGGLCDPVLLNSLIGPRTLVICDIEGGELDLLDPALAPNLSSCDLIVEVHDGEVLGGRIEAALIERFKATHRLEFKMARVHSYDPSVGGVEVPCKWRDHVAREWRELGIRWIRMTAKGD